MAAHKRAEFLKAFADGIEVQWRNLKNWYPLTSKCLALVEKDHIEFRIKPTPPKEPDYAQIVQSAWYATPAGKGNTAYWLSAANAAIEAYKAHEKALKEFKG